MELPLRIIVVAVIALAAFILLALLLGSLAGGAGNAVTSFFGNLGKLLSPK